MIKKLTICKMELSRLAWTVLLSLAVVASFSGCSTAIAASHAQSLPVANLIPMSVWVVYGVATAAFLAVRALENLAYKLGFLKPKYIEEIEEMHAAMETMMAQVAELHEWHSPISTKEGTIFSWKMDSKSMVDELTDLVNNSKKIVSEVDELKKDATEGHADIIRMTKESYELMRRMHEDMRLERKMRGRD